MYALKDHWLHRRNRIDSPFWLKASAPFLWLSALLFGLILLIRHFCFDRGFFRIKRADCLVVSVGNIALGGSGKTPLVIKLACEIAPVMDVAILSRGFGGRWTRGKGKSALVSLAAGMARAALLYGDEPTLLAHKTGCPVWVGVSRARSARLAVEAGASLLFLDDGMQHRSFHRDLEIVMVKEDDCLTHYGSSLVPYGNLRERLNRLALADYLFVTHTNNEETRKTAKSFLRRWSNAPLIYTQHRIEPVVAQKIHGRRVALFCAIASPTYFVQGVRECGACICFSWFLQDHGRPSQDQFTVFIEQARAKGAEVVVCTEKDWVKLIDYWTPIPLIPLPVLLELVSGHHHWRALLDDCRRHGFA